MQMTKKLLLVFMSKYGSIFYRFFGNEPFQSMVWLYTVIDRASQFTALEKKSKWFPNGFRRTNYAVSRKEIYFFILLAQFHIIASDNKTSHFEMRY